MTLIWFIVRLIANNAGGHEPLLFTRQRVDRHADPRDRARSDRVARSRGAEEPTMKLYALGNRNMERTQPPAEPPKPAAESQKPTADQPKPMPRPP